ncbi:MAG: tRNA uridine-5-carboxymethylaminomethyl(34) synthesis GTPase MnmE [Acidobacteriaceae bacterium]
MQPDPHLVYQNETIVAVATPPGRGGIGIVRLSGPEATGIAEPMLRLRNPLAHAQARFADLLDLDTQEKLDEAVVTFFAAPNSYTGEDVVEVAAHGSPVILDTLVRQALAGGARLAAPGEFTQRAFLSGRIDLTQAEAVHDLIEAQTLYQARVAAQQLHGALSRRIKPIKEGLVALIALLEAGIDFAEDDVDVLPGVEILSRIEEIRVLLQPVADSFARGRIVQAGLMLAIVGRPNAGKSSLFNRIVQRERAIVTAAPGTTRDPVTERLSLGGIPVELVDTAGMREASDEAEQIGIRKSREALADADMVLMVLDATAAPGQEELELLATLAQRRALVVVNKSDLAQPSAAMEDALGGLGLPVVHTSALSGQGVSELKEKMLAMVGDRTAETESGMLTSLRQYQAVTATLEGLTAAAAAAGQNIPHEMVLLDLYGALRHLDSLTGETTSDDILNLIFSTFCIGK